MNKKIRMITIITAIFIIFNVFNVNISLARPDLSLFDGITVEDGGDSSLSSGSTSGSTSLTINPNDYDPSKNPITTDDTDQVFKKVGVILGAVRNFSAVVAVITLMIIGLKYMFGSVEQKANYKATMMPYIIGCVLAVAGTTIVTFIYNSVYNW